MPPDRPERPAGRAAGEDSTEARKRAKAQGIDVKDHRRIPAGLMTKGHGGYRQAGSKRTEPALVVAVSLTCRCECFTLAQIYTQNGILAHALATLRATAIKLFPAF